MITGTLKLFGESDLARLHGAVLRVLESTGIKVYDNTFLEALCAAGGRVDRATRTARFAAPMVEGLIAERSTRAWLPARELGEQPQKLKLGLSSVIAPFYYDYEWQARRRASRHDLLNTVHWAEVDLSPEREVGLAVTMGEVDPRVEPVEAYALLLEHTGRPGRAYTTDAAQIPFLVDLATAYYGEPVFPRGPDFMTSPLTLGQRLAEHTLAAIDAGQQHFSCGVMPISGGSAPITVAGSVVIAAAEMLGMWLAIRSVIPSATFSGSVCSGIMDLRKGTACFNAPEALLTDLGVAELFNRRCGGGVGVAAGSDYVDAALPGIQAAYERTYRAMAIAAFVGEHFHLGGQGTLDAGRVFSFSPVQFIVEHDLSEGLRRLGQGIEVTDEAIGLDTIEDIGAGECRSYLEAAHTLRHFRETWFPRFLYRGVYQDDDVEHAREQQMLDAANQHYKEAIARYTPPPVEDEVLRDIRKVVQRARRALVR